LDGLLNYYNLTNTKIEIDIIAAFHRIYPTLDRFPKPYIAESASNLKQSLSTDLIKGITCSCSGFYAPQGRKLRYELGRPDILEVLTSFSFDTHRITNFEMETGAMYGLAKLLGHECCSINLIVANRIRQEFSSNYKTKMNEMIEMVLDRIDRM